MKLNCKKKTIQVLSACLLSFITMGATLCFGLPSAVRADAEIVPATYTVADLNGYNSPTDFNWMSRNWNVKTICGTAVNDPSGGYGAPCFNGKRLLSDLRRFDKRTSFHSVVYF